MGNPRKKNKFNIVISKNGRVLSNDILESVQNIIINSKNITIEFILLTDSTLLEQLQIDELYKIVINDFLDEYTYLNKFCFLGNISYELSKAENNSITVVARFSFIEM